MTDIPQPPQAPAGQPAPAAATPVTPPPPPWQGPQWEYRVIHINVDNNAPAGPPDPQADSARMGGQLSPEFLRDQFPQQYENQPKPAPRHPAEQLQQFLNTLGREGWQMVEAAQVGPLLMFFFKRPMPPAPEASAASTGAPAEASTPVAPTATSEPGQPTLPPLAKPADGP